jgi:hypothetical protein
MYHRLGVELCGVVQSSRRGLTKLQVLEAAGSEVGFEGAKAIAEVLIAGACPDLKVRDCMGISDNVPPQKGGRLYAPLQDQSNPRVALRMGRCST